MSELASLAVGLARLLGSAFRELRSRVPWLPRVPQEVKMASAPSVLDYINTFVTVATFLISEQLPVTIESIRKFFEPRGIAPPPDVTSPQALKFINLLVIDQDLLDDLTDETREGVKRYANCLKMASTTQERAACDRRAEKDVCDTLNRIKDRNEGDLPTDYLDKQWRSFGCVRV